MQEKVSKQLPDSVIDEEYGEILSEVMNISVDTPAETLRTLELNVVQRQIDLAPYAGNAFLTDDKEMMSFLKGQYFALEGLRKFIGEKYLRLVVEQDEKEEKEKEWHGQTFVDHVKKQMATLLPHDHHLFEELVWGLVKEGWKHKGGSPTYALLNKQGAAIKLFRPAEAPAVIHVCFSAEPEETSISEPEIDEVKDV